MKKTYTILHNGNSGDSQADATAPLKERNDYANFLDTLPQPVFELNSERRVTYVNPAALDILELTADHLAAGLDALAVIAPEHADKIADAFRRVMDGEALNGFEADFRTKSGRFFPGAIYCSRIVTDGQVFVRGFVTDISERKAAEELLQVQRDISQELTQTSNIEDAFRLVLRAVSRLEDIDCGGIYLVEETGCLRLISHFGLSEEFVQSVAFCEAGSPRATVAIAGKPIYVSTTAELGIPDDDMAREGIQALAIVPIMFDGSVQAVMNVAAHRTRELPLRTRHALEAISLRLGGAISRLKTIRALHDSEEKFRTMAEQMMDVLFMTDAAGVITYISPSAHSLFGWNPTDMIGKPFLDFLPDEEIQRAIFAFQSAGTTGKRTKNLCLRMKRKDGSFFVGELNAAAASKHDAYTGTVGLIRNISDREAVEEEQRLHRDRLRIAIEGGKVGLWDWDLISNQVYYSPEWKRQIGYEDYEISSKFEEWESRVHPDDLASTLSSVKMALSPPYPPHKVEFRFQHKDGSYRWIMAQSALQFDKQGKPTRMFGSHVDITERKQAEERLLQSRLELRQTLDATTDGIWTWNLETNRLTFSPRYYTILGYDPNEFPATYESWHSRLHPDDRETALRRFEDFLQASRKDYDNEFRLKTKSGDYRWIRARARVVESDAQGKPRLLIGNHEDITDRKQAEEALRENEDRYRTVISSVSEGIILQDCSGVVLTWNKAAEAISGIGAGDIIGRQPAEHTWKTSREDGTPFPVDEHPSTITLRTGKPCKSVLMRVQHAITDHWSWISINTNPIFEKRGTKLRAVAISFADVTARKQAEDELRESRLRLSNAIRLAKLGDWEYDVDNDLFTFNDEFFAIFRTTAEEVGGYAMSSADYAERFVHPDDRHLVTEETRMAMETSDPDFSRRIEHRFLYADGEMGYMAVQFRIVKDHTGRTIKTYGMNQDITERKRAEEERLASETRYQSLFENMLNGFAYCRMHYDAQGHPEDFTYLAVNSAFESQTGLKDVVGKKVTEVIPGIREADPELFEIYGRVAKTGQPERFETYVEPMDMWFWISVYSPQPEHFVAVFDVITERKRAEEALRESEKRYRELFDSMTSGFALHEMILDDSGFPRDYRFLEVNPAFEQLTGLKASNIVGHTVLEVLPNTEPYWIETYGKVALTGETLRFENYSQELGKHYEVMVYSPQPGRFATIFQDVTERKQAEEALKRREEQLRILFDNLTIGVYRTTPDGRILIANPALVKMLGYTSFEELASRNLESDGFHPTYPRDHFKTLIGCDGEIRALESAWRNCARETIYIRENARAVRGEDGAIQYYEGTVEDITEHKRDEAALRASEERFKQVAENAGEWIWEVDAEGLYTYSSPVVEKILGYRPNELVGKLHFYDLFVPDEREELKTAAFSAFSQQASFRGLVNPNLHKNGSVVILETSATPILDHAGNLLGYRGTDTDITERKRIEEALQESEQRYRFLAENATDYIWAMDMNLKATYISPSVLRLRGFSVEEAMAHQLEDTLTPESLALALRALQEELARGPERDNNLEHVRTLELELKRKDGSTVWTETNASIVWDAEGKPIGILGSTRDISERKRAEKEREQLEAQLRRAQKMEAIGTLAGGIAHDFNNILTPIMAYTEMAVEALPEQTPIRSDLEHVIEAANRAKDLVRQILTFSRQTEQARFSMSLAPIVKETLKLIRASLPTTISIREYVAPHAGEVVADPSQMHQVLMNLCTNASAAMRESGGEMSIRLDNVTLGEDFVRGHPRLHEGDYVRLSVSDTGCGMDTETLGRIFEPFFTTKPVGEGTGLGLSVVHGIITASGGDILVTSEPGHGTRFDTYLPKAGQPALEVSPPDVAVRSGNERVLLIDDEPAIARVGLRVLESYGYRVTTRTSSIEGLEAFRADPDRFDLIITDQTMPHMTGLQLAKEVRALRPELPIILISGFSNQVDESVIQNLGINALLLKPLVSSDLARAVRHVLDQHQAAAKRES